MSTCLYPRRDETTACGYAHTPTKHQPMDDDGVTYCGWHAGNGVVSDGCGEVWPCSTVRGVTGE